MFNEIKQTTQVSVLSAFFTVLAVLAIFALLHLKLHFPVCRDCHESVLEPDQVFSVAPVRRQHVFTLVYRLSWRLGNLPEWYVYIYVPEYLVIYHYFIEEATLDFT